MNDDCRTRRERKFDNQHRLINFNLTLIIFTYNYVQHNLYTLGLKAHHLNNSGLRSCPSMFLIFFLGVASSIVSWYVSRLGYNPENIIE